MTIRNITILFLIVASVSAAIGRETRGPRLKRIVGGEDSGSNEFPFQVSLRYSDTVHICGGALISERHVLSAAHCVCELFDEPYDDLSVVTGTRSVKKGGQFQRVKSIHCHPDYVFGAKGSWTHDLVIITLSDNVILNSAQNLIDLPVSDAPENVSVILTGWGRHHSFGPLSDILQKVTLTTITNEDCQTYYNNTILPSHLCTLEHEGVGACKIPEMAQYIPNFITKEEEERIIKHINAVPLPKWTQLSYRRLQNWGGIPHPKGMIAEEIPSWLQIYIDKIISLNVFERNKPPNHVLINEYLPSQGIMAHSDGPLFYPIVTTISCGSHTLLDFYKRNDIMEPQQLKLEFSLLLERRSLLILRGDLYNDYLHAIAETCTDTISKGIIKNMNMCALEYNEGQVLKRGTRLSLTIRHVPKTSKLKLKIG